MLPEQKAYIYAWVDGVAAGGFRAGIYCSGIVFEESPGVRVVTADDIRQHAESRKIEYWVTNDACPPSPGCAFPRQPPPPSDSGTRSAKVWQFAQSPKRNDVAAGCPANYHADGSCYPPGIALARALARGCRHRHLARSVGRPDSLSFGARASSPANSRKPDRRSLARGKMVPSAVDLLGHASVPATSPGYCASFPQRAQYLGGRSVTGGSHFGRTKRRLFPLSLSIQTGSNKRTTGGFNIPVGWAC